MNSKDFTSRLRRAASRCGPDALFALIWLIGALARLYGAWCSRYITDYDVSVVGLMARHMAEGREFPVFFYGQPYMGSLEPSVSALLFLLFGESGFALTAGTAGVAALALWAAMRWANDIGGRPAAWAAGLFLAMGPLEFYAFQFAPRGGYMTSLLFGILVLWLGARVAADLREGRSPSGWRYGVIGVCAGLGWWSSQMVTSALMVCAGQVAIAARFRLHRIRILPAVAGFLAGSLPFWLWNLAHGFATFRMTGDLGSVSPWTGLPLLARRYRQFLGAWPSFSWSSGLLWGLYLTGMAMGIAAMVREFRRRRVPPLALASAVAAAAHLGLSLLIYVTSAQIEMNTSRFLVPMWPSAVLVALAGILWLPFRRWRTPILGSFALAAAITQALILPRHAHRAERIEGLRGEDREFAAWLERSGIETVYTHLQDYPLNFRIGERVPFTSVLLERYPPFAKAAERAEHIGVIGNHGAIRSMIRHTGASAKISRVGRWSVAHAFMPPAGRLREIDPADWTAGMDDRGHDLRALIADRNPDTQWAESSAPSGEAYVEVRFDRPRPLREIRVWSPDDASFPVRLKVEALAEAAGPWRVIHEDAVASPFYWSGPRPFYAGRRAFWSCRLPDDPDIHGVRLTRMPHDRPHRIWRMAELQIFEPQPGSKPAYSAEYLSELMGLLRQRGHRRLYAGRWLSLHMHDALEGRVAVELSSPACPGESGGLDSGGVILDAHTALAVEEEDLPQTLRALESAGLAARTLQVGPWTLVDFDPAEFSDPVPVDSGLWWSGRSLWPIGPSP